jgi:hypothetical protein
MIRHISVGIKPILEFSPVPVLGDFQTHFFGAGLQSKRAEDPRVSWKGPGGPKSKKRFRHISSNVVSNIHYIPNTKGGIDYSLKTISIGSSGGDLPFEGLRGFFISSE